MAVVVLRHESAALRDNPLGDPHVRDLHVVVPDDLDPTVPVPCVWYLSGHAGVGRAMLSHDPWQEGLEERLARLRADGKIGPMIVALPDCFNRFGGTQYLSSSAVGDYETYLLHELRAKVEQRFAVSAHAIAGKSSGGFGAIVHAMRHPELFRAVACHSGDMGFALALTSELALAMNAIRDHGGVTALVEKFDRAVKKKEGRWLAPISVLALAAVYSPDPSKPLGLALPFDLDTGALDEAVFARWLAWDPARMIDDPRHQDALRSLDLVYVDAGKRDEYHLHWGARTFHTKAERYGVRHVYEEFDDGHRNTGYRLDTSLPLLYAALTR
ncbi:esterase family protein [Myxococcota bacterium]|nr:esterase family protein [Myxococcota bacterium]